MMSLLSGLRWNNGNICLLYWNNKIGDFIEESAGFLIDGELSVWKLMEIM